MVSRTERPGGPLAILMLALMLAVSALPAEASLLRGLSARELRAGSEAIVTGEVVGVRVVRTERSIETVARVRVQQSHRGRTDKVLTVRVPGGERDGLRLVVPGAPSFRRGDTVLLFLARDGGEYRPVGLFQGVWTIDPAAPQMAVAGDPGGASLLPSPDGDVAIAAGRLPLSDLVGGGR